MHTFWIINSRRVDWINKNPTKACPPDLQMGPRFAVTYLISTQYNKTYTQSEVEKVQPRGCAAQGTSRWRPQCSRAQVAQNQPNRRVSKIDDSTPPPSCASPLCPAGLSTPPVSRGWTPGVSLYRHHRRRRVYHALRRRVLRGKRSGCPRPPREACLSKGLLVC